MLGTKRTFAQTVAAVMGLTGSVFSRRRAFDSFTSAVKPRQWHDPKRQQAAVARRALRQLRNLRQADAGGYGQHWQAL